MSIRNVVTVVIVAAFLSYGKVDKAVQEQWTEEFMELQEEISQVHQGGLGKSLPTAMYAAPQSRVAASDRDPLDIVLRRTESLINCMARLRNAPDLRAAQRSLAAIKARAAQATLGKLSAEAATNRTDLFYEACLLRRGVALANPLMDFDSMVVVTGELSSQNVANRYLAPWHLDKPSGIFLVSGLKAKAPKAKSLVAGQPVVKGRYAGKDLTSFTSSYYQTLSLSLDGKQVLFAWAEGQPQPFPRSDGFAYASDIRNWTPGTVSHIFRCNLDGSNLTQLTDGIYNDYSPIELPNKRIVFISERRRTDANGEVFSGNLRCANEGFMPQGVLQSMKPDGSDLITISYHETNDLDPWVANDGTLVYTRWDYVDRDFSAGHSIWTCFPDGRDPRAPHGNYFYPLYTDSYPAGYPFEDGRTKKPFGEYYIKPIPGSTKFMAIASAHHKSVWGVPIVIDCSIKDDFRSSQVIILDPQSTGFPFEACSNAPKPVTCRYSTPWPLSEDFFIVTTGKSVILVDKFGNKETLWSVSAAPDVWGSTGVTFMFPTPVKPRTPVPVSVAEGTYQGQRSSKDAPKAVMGVLNVYESDFEWPANTQLKELRIIQIIPKPVTSPKMDRPFMGYSRGGIGRMVLGTVPVEEDGSAYFEAPVEREIYFQAVDAQGLAIQSMRSGTYVHKGEKLVCTGCHEEKTQAVKLTNAIAFRRSPSKIKPDVDGSCPLTFDRLAYPVLSKKCFSCHYKEGKGPTGYGKWTDIGSQGKYAEGGGLEPYAFYFHATEWCHSMTPFRGGSRSHAGKFGARGSRLFKYLDKSHYGVTLTDEEFHRITLWLDCNSMKHSAYENTAAQDKGQVVWPSLDVDSANPTGVEIDRTVAELNDGMPENAKISKAGITLIPHQRALRVRNTTGKIATVVVTNLEGRVLHSLRIASGQDAAIVRLSISMGMYIINVKAGTHTVSQLVNCALLQ